MAKLLTTLATASGLALNACALDPFALSDPKQALGIGPKPNEVVNSLRCEVVTFLVENKLRSEIRSSILEEMQREYTTKPEAFDKHKALIDRYPAIQIDSQQFAALILELKNINSASASIGADWRMTSRVPGHIATYHAGASYSDTGTFTLNIPLALAQNADLGPTKSFDPRNAPKLPGAAAFTTAYFRHPEVDEAFYCYKSLATSTGSVTLLDAAEDIQHLVQSDPNWSAYENYQRIRVGNQTLAHWLQTTASEMTRVEQTIFETGEKSLIGQLNYFFVLSAKPSIDFKYTFIAQVLNPMVPSAAASLEHVGTFSIYLNTENVAYALNAKNGNTRIVQNKAKR